MHPVCPFKAPRFNYEKNIVEMYTLCVHRVDKDLESTCIQYGLSGALRFGYIKSLAKRQDERGRTELLAEKGGEAEVSTNAEYLALTRRVQDKEGLKIVEQTNTNRTNSQW